MELNKIICGNTLDVLKTFPNEFIDCVITSPPYFSLRDYRVDNQIGLEKSLEEYLGKLLSITKELYRVLKKTGTMFWNHGDCFSQSGGAGSQYDKSQGKERLEGFKKYGGKKASELGFQPKCLIMQNYRLVERMVDEQNFILRSIIIWHKINAMPSSAKDRFSVDFEPVFFLTKSQKYYFETQYEPYKESMNRWGGEKLKANGGSDWDQGTGQITYRDRNMRPNPKGRQKRCVWSIPTKPLKEQHYAAFPERLIEPMIKAGTPEFICKKCGKTREKIIEASGGTIGKSWHDHSKDKEEGMHQSLGGLDNQGDEKYQVIDKGYTDCYCNVGWNKGIVLDPFMGSGTTGVVAKKLGRNYLGIDLNPEYCKMAEKRIIDECGELL